MKVLTVEDNALDRAVLRHSLTRSGHEVVEAFDGEAAWAILQHDPLRLVVSDWVMPNADGLELCRRIRARADTDYLYFILVTVRGDTGENQRLAADAGVDDFLTKPFDPDELWNRVRVVERILACNSRVRRLEAMLPICSYCKKIRGEHNHWQTVEKFIMEQSGREFSHSICPDCYREIVLPQLETLDGAQP